MKYLTLAGTEQGRTYWLHHGTSDDDAEGLPGNKRVHVHTLLLSDLHLAPMRRGLKQ